DRALSDHPQYWRRDHGIEPEDKRGEPLSAELGCAESFRLRRIGVSAERRLQSHGHRCSSRLCVGRRHHKPISEIARPAGSGMKRAAVLATVVAGTLAGSPVFPQAPPGTAADPMV